MNTRRRSDRDVAGDPSRLGRKQLPPRNLVEEQLPPRARHERGQIDPGVFATAVTIHNRVIDPSTGLRWPHDNRSIESSFVSSCENMILECQDWTRKQCEPDDHESLERTNEALEVAKSAKEVTRKLEITLGEHVNDPRGGRSPIREVLANYKSDQALAAARQREGDTRHLDKPVDGAWVVVAAVVFAVLDLLLLWRPVLQLTALDSARMLSQWVVAVALSAAVAYFIESAVRRYQRAERDSTDRRDAVRDRNRTVASDNRAARGAPSPDPHQIDTADGKLRFAGGLLLCAAAATAVIGAARVAVLARHSNLSILEAALFAVVAALFLGGLVVLMGLLSCRGNQLGERLRIGTDVVTSVEQRDRDARANVADVHEEARQLLVAADEAAARGDQLCAWIIEGYLRSILLACGWCNLHRSVLDDVQLSFGASSRPFVEQATIRRGEVLAELDKTRPWLEKPHGVVERLRQKETVPALAAAAPASGGMRSMAPPKDGEDGIVDPYAIALPEEPRLSLWLMALGAAVVVVTAVVVAILTSPPEGDPHRQALGSAPAASISHLPPSAAWAESAPGTS